MILRDDLPGAFALQELLEALGLRHVECAKASTPAQGELSSAVYVERGTATPVAVAVMDLPCTVSLAAALVGIPPVVAQEAIRDGVVGDNLVENYHEVVNILATLITSTSIPSVTLSETTVAPASFAPVVGSFLLDKHQTSYRIDMAGYPGGVLTLAGRP